MTKIAKAVYDATLARFQEQGLKTENLAIGVGEIDRSRKTLRSGSFRGGEQFYPASCVKLFYLAYGARQFELHKLEKTDETARAFHDMIVDSVNDATALVVDTLTGTTGGPELSKREFADWTHRRNVVNRWYADLGYRDINVCQKTWNEGPYGRERQSYGPHYENRNALTVDASLRLMGEIALETVGNGKFALTPASYEWMRSLLARPIPADGPTTDSQSTDFTGKILPKGALLWSKAGWTSDARHDIAWVKMPGGREFLVVTFTRSASNVGEIIPFAADMALKELAREPTR